MVRQVCPLLPHDLPHSPDLLVSAEYVWSEEGILELSYSLRPRRPDCDLQGLAWPQYGLNSPSGQRKDRLWEHSCFEAFLGLPGSPMYWELNISPSGQWNLYEFESYRQRSSGLVAASPPKVNMRRTPRDCRCDVVLDLRPWWPTPSMPELGLTAVIEDKSGQLSYWALSHPADDADFHDRRSFLNC